jgi:NADH:ubiquinone oxidoreductase subunit H
MGAITQFCESMNKAFYYITHPKETGLIIWNFIDHESYFICMLVCLIALCLYLCGWEKGKKVTVNSTLVFILIKMLSTAFK